MILPPRYADKSHLQASLDKLQAGGTFARREGKTTALQFLMLSVALIGPDSIKHVVCVTNTTQMASIWQIMFAVDLNTCATFTHSQFLLTTHTPREVQFRFMSIDYLLAPSNMAGRTEQTDLMLFDISDLAKRAMQQERFDLLKYQLNRNNTLMIGLQND